MKIYKFKDDVDGNYAFVMAESIGQATDMIKEETSIRVNFENMANAEDFPACTEKLDNKAGIWINQIMPF